MRYVCWKSHTCYVCSGGTGKPVYHASSKGYRPTSPCDTVARTVEASTRAEALRIFKQQGRR